MKPEYRPREKKRFNPLPSRSCLKKSAHLPARKKVRLPVIPFWKGAPYPRPLAKYTSALPLRRARLRRKAPPLLSSSNKVTFAQPEATWLRIPPRLRTARVRTSQNPGSTQGRSARAPGSPRSRPDCVPDPQTAREKAPLVQVPSTSAQQSAPLEGDMGCGDGADMTKAVRSLQLVSPNSGLDSSPSPPPPAAAPLQRRRPRYLSRRYLQQMEWYRALRQEKKLRDARRRLGELCSEVATLYTPHLTWLQCIFGIYKHARLLTRIKMYTLEDGTLKTGPCTSLLVHCSMTGSADSTAPCSKKRKRSPQSNRSHLPSNSRQKRAVRRSWKLDSSSSDSPVSDTGKPSTRAKGSPSASAGGMKALAAANSALAPRSDPKTKRRPQSLPSSYSSSLRNSPAAGSAVFSVVTARETTPNKKPAGRRYKNTVGGELGTKRHSVGAAPYLHTRPRSKSPASVPEYPPAVRNAKSQEPPRHTVGDRKKSHANTAPLSKPSSLKSRPSGAPPLDRRSRAAIRAAEGQSSASNAWVTSPPHRALRGMSPPGNGSDPAYGPPGTPMPEDDFWLSSNCGSRSDSSPAARRSTPSAKKTKKTAPPKATPRKTLFSRSGPDSSGDTRGHRGARTQQRASRDGAAVEEARTRDNAAGAQRIGGQKGAARSKSHSRDRAGGTTVDNPASGDRADFKRARPKARIQPMGPAGSTESRDRGPAPDPQRPRSPELIETLVNVMSSLLGLQSPSGRPHARDTGGQPHPEQGKSCPTKTLEFLRKLNAKRQRLQELKRRVECLTLELQEAREELEGEMTECCRADGTVGQRALYHQKGEPAPLRHSRRKPRRPAGMERRTETSGRPSGRRGQRASATPFHSRAATGRPSAWEAP
ncbi:hypothetical protein AAFF_G00423890 [Aldrovandia affinis]|uniref:Uncharacterized protein n=1 Tax=Aldrovandia affinis TaxID=143900 RepID=A0AAD7X0Z2_9TELE|nr:hypothetical protein AAFF_G00423890 [Aldrovandia affinis]